MWFQHVAELGIELDVSPGSQSAQNCPAPQGLAQSAVRSYPSQEKQPWQESRMTLLTAELNFCFHSKQDQRVNAQVSQAT